MIKINQIEPLIQQVDIDAVNDYMQSDGWITEHTKTKELESILAEYLCVKHCIMTTSGTSALLLAFNYLKNKLTSNSPNGVIVPDYTMIASANAPKYLGFDITLCNTCLTTVPSFTDIINAVTKETAAIVYPTLNGRTGDIKRVTKFCKERSIFLVEDACQSLGSQSNGKMLGTFGNVGCFSLSPHKIITTGQGGFIVTDSDEINKSIRRLKNFGRYEEGTDNFYCLGINHKYTDLQASLGISQMKSIDYRINKKRLIYNTYYKSLKYTDNVHVIYRNKKSVAWFVDVIFDKNIDVYKLHKNLNQRGIGTRKFYPPLHTQPPYNTDNNLDRFSKNTASFLSNQGLYLPSSLNLSAQNIEMICDTIKEEIINCKR